MENMRNRLILSGSYSQDSTRKFWFRWLKEVQSKTFIPFFFFLAILSFFINPYSISIEAEQAGGAADEEVGGAEGGDKKA